MTTNDSVISNYVLAQGLEQYFVDKDTGLPLSGGIVTFYSDVNRSTKKNVYQLTGTPPYSVNSYVALPNPIILSGVGTPLDTNGNDTAIYYFPYTDASASTVENYYVTVYSSGGALQFTRLAQPDISAEDSPIAQIEEINYIPNGQLLLNNSNNSHLPTSSPSGTNINYNPIAYGGFYWAVSSASSAVDTITFPRFNSTVVLPDGGSPRYAVNVNRTVASTGDTVSDIRIRFNDINKFSAPSDQQYLLQFTAQSAGSTLNNVKLNLYQYFGTGGTPHAPNTIALNTSISIPTSEMVITNLITIPPPSGALGTNDDDYIELCINLNATNSTWNVQFTDFILTPASSANAMKFLQRLMLIS